MHIIPSVRKVAVHLRYASRLYTLVDITSNTFYKRTATLRTQICRKCSRIKLNGFRNVQKLEEITSNTFYKCTATFRTPCTIFMTLEQVEKYISFLL
jgi:hypothetical protein